MMVKIEAWVEEETAALLPYYAKLKSHGSKSGAIRYAIGQMFTRSPLTAPQIEKLPPDIRSKL